ncbi:hypothetical protein [Acinetobacter sp. MD2(2019)]|uniref:hypothetical protein n=1 Tax=Acinetobacter sp. MD2(2019) TaxID=2605273 RepID=UPI002D1E72BB|nr:hypothetical protein [Acinetobacter sp. MD2(2019)]MEB3754025.1 hypothetical protein [Acinetobacter sp. MD2(2019)]
MSQDLKQRDRKRWTIFAIALCIPMLLVLGLFFAAKQDAQTKKEYDQLSTEYANERQARENQQHLNSEQQYQQLQKDQEAQLSKPAKP